MNLCSDGHEEVCYECRNCPVCVALRDVGIQETRVDERDETIADLRDELSQAQADIEALEAKED